MAGLEVEGLFTAALGLAVGATLAARFEAVVRGMFEHRSNAFVGAMNGMLQQAKRAARSFNDAATFISIAYLRMGKLTHTCQARPSCRLCRAMCVKGRGGCEVKFHGK